jgi:hypothetical protein
LASGGWSRRARRLLLVVAEEARALAGLVVAPGVVDAGRAGDRHQHAEQRHQEKVGQQRKQPPVRRRARRRALDSELLAKMVVREGVLQDRPGPSLAVEAGAILPTIPVAGGVGAAVTVIASERWPGLALHLNAEGDYTRDHTFAFIGGFIIEGPGAWPVRPVGEFYLSHEGSLPVTVSGLAGAIWRAGPHLTFDAAGRLADQVGEREIEIRAGLTWAFGI